MTTEPGPVFDPVHFSNLKQFALSPAHYKASLAEPWEDTAAMRIGTGVHHLVLGGHKTRPCIHAPFKDRRSGDWKKYAADQNPRATLLTEPEWLEAQAIAAAVITDPVARQLLDGCRREVELTWDDAGIACETDGIDFVGDGYIGDLKSTTCTEPAAFSRHAVKLLYHAQMAWLDTGARGNGIDTSKGLFLIGVEARAPFAVTCLRLVPPVIDIGRKSVCVWLEKLRSCRENDHWPAYTQSIVEFEMPTWMGADDDE